MGGFNRKTAILLCIVLSLVFSNLGFVSAQSVNGAGGMTDLQGNWAEEPISRWLDQGLVAGYSDQTFKPGSTISRAEFVALVNRAFGFNEQGQTNYSDVPASKWYSADVAKATLAGYVSGFADGSFMPDAVISRQEAAKIIAELAKLETSGASSLNGFKDASQIPQWSLPYLNAVVANGYLTGFMDGTLKPTQSISRAEAVVLLDRIAGTLIQSPGTTGGETEQTIAGNVTINAAGATLKNTVITGDLYLAAGIGEGEVYLDNVTVKGRTIVAGGGENSVVLNDANLNEVIVEKAKGKVRLFAKGKTNIAKTIVKSGAKLQTENEEQRFANVEIANRGENVELQGRFGQVDVKNKLTLVVIAGAKLDELIVGAQAEGTVVNAGDLAVLISVVLNAPVKMDGKGTIRNVEINAQGTTIELTVEKYTLGNGVTLVVINGKEVTANPDSNGNSGANPPTTTTPPTTTPPTDPGPAPSPEPSPNPGTGFGDEELPDVYAAVIIGDKVYSYFDSYADYSALSYELEDSVNEAVYGAAYSGEDGQLVEFTIDEGEIPASNYAAYLTNGINYDLYDFPMVDTISANEAVYGHVYYEGLDDIRYRINDYIVSDLDDQVTEGAVPLADGDRLTLSVNEYFLVQATWNAAEKKWVLDKVGGISAPGGLTAEPVSDTQIKVQWEQDSDADYYYLYTSDTADGPYIPVTDSVGGKLKMTGSSYAVSGIAPNTTRYFKATSFREDIGMESALSEAASAKTYSNEHLELGFVPTDSVLNSDEPILYMTDKANKKLYALNYETRELTSVSFDLPPESLTYADGEIYVSLLKMKHDPYTDTESGAIAIVNAADLTVEQVYDIDLDPYDIAVGRDGYIYVSSGSSQWTDVISYSRSDTALSLVESSMIRQQSFIEMHPTLNKLYAINTDVSPRDLSAYNLLNGEFVENSYPGGYDSPYHGTYAMSTKFRLSPDGRFIFNGAGTVFQAADNEEDDMVYVGKLNKGFEDIAFDIANDRFFTVTANAKGIGIYDYATFAQRGALLTDGLGQAIFNGSGQLFALTTFGEKSIIEFIRS